LHEVVQVSLFHALELHDQSHKAVVVHARQVHQLRLNGAAKFEESGQRFEISELRHELHEGLFILSDDGSGRLVETVNLTGKTFDVGLDLLVIAVYLLHVDQSEVILRQLLGELLKFHGGGLKLSDVDDLGLLDERHDSLLSLHCGLLSSGLTRLGRVEFSNNLALLDNLFEERNVEHFNLSGLFDLLQNFAAEVFEKTGVEVLRSDAVHELLDLLHVLFDEVSVGGFSPERHHFLVEGRELVLVKLKLVGELFKGGQDRFGVGVENGGVDDRFKVKIINDLLDLVGEVGQLVVDQIRELALKVNFQASAVATSLDGLATQDGLDLSDGGLNHLDALDVQNAALHGGSQFLRKSNKAVSVDNIVGADVEDLFCDVCGQLVENIEIDQIDGSLLPDLGDLVGDIGNFFLINNGVAHNNLRHDKLNVLRDLLLLLLGHVEASLSDQVVDKSRCGLIDDLLGDGLHLLVEIGGLFKAI